LYNKQQEKKMRLGYLVLATLMTTTTLPAVAQESGHWHGLAVLVNTDQKVVKLQDQPNHMAFLMDEDGVVHTTEGKFLDKARYQVTALYDSAVGGYGYKTFTEADGSKVFAKYQVTESKPPEVNGTFEFTGGTDKYTGITGKGTFHLVRVGDKAAWDELTGDYTIPKKAAQQ
jgi:hypothetical protein